MNSSKTSARMVESHCETRFSSGVFTTQKGLTHQQVVSSVLKGLARGKKTSEFIRD